MASPYRDSVAYRGQSFVAVTAPKAINQKGSKTKNSIGLSEEEKDGLKEALYSWKKEDSSKSKG